MVSGRGQFDGRGLTCGRPSVVGKGILRPGRVARFSFVAVAAVAAGVDELERAAGVAVWAHEGLNGV